LLQVKYANAPSWEPDQGEQGGHEESSARNNDIFDVPPVPGDQRQDQIVKVEIIRAPEFRDFDGWHLDGAYGLRLHFADGGVRPFSSDGRQVAGWWGNYPVDDNQSDQVSLEDAVGYNTVLSLSYPGYILSSVLAPGPDSDDPGHNYQGALSFIFGWRRSDSYPDS
jgi:hypothetical protein